MRAVGPYNPSPTALGTKIILIICFCPLLVPAFVLPNPAPLRPHTPSFHRRMFCQDPTAVTPSTGAWPPQRHHLTKVWTVLSTRVKIAEAIRCALLRGKFAPLGSNLASLASYCGSNVNCNLSRGSWRSSATLHTSSSSSRSRSSSSSSSEVMQHAAMGSELPEGKERSEPKKKSKKGNGGAKGGGRGDTEEAPSKAKAGRGGEGGGPPGYREGVKAEFSREIDCSELSRKAKYYTIEATHRECTSLAKRFSVESIANLKADFRVLRGSGRESLRINIKGRVKSDVCQLCASSLEPFDVAIRKEFDTVVQEVSLDSVESTLWALDTDTDTEDEIMEGDPLDLGEIAAQAVALCIDPFAKRPSESTARAGEGRRSAGITGSTGRQEEEEGEIIDVAAMKAFFEADD